MWFISERMVLLKRSCVIIIPNILLIQMAHLQKNCISLKVQLTAAFISLLGQMDRCRGISIRSAVHIVSESLLTNWLCVDTLIYYIIYCIYMVDVEITHPWLQNKHSQIVLPSVILLLYFQSEATLDCNPGPMFHILWTTSREPHRPLCCASATLYYWHL